MEIDGLLARVILHEIDHLNGVLFIDHLSKEKRKAHAKALKEIQRNEIEVSYPIVSAEALSV
jgi:peptide deformylase